MEKITIDELVSSWKSPKEVEDGIRELTKKYKLRQNHLTGISCQQMREYFIREFKEKVNSKIE